MKLLEALVSPHGADTYGPDGRPLAGLDFSSTVLALGPPEGWRQRAAEALDCLLRYPQPRGRGVDARLAEALGLPEKSLLLSSGASEALEWLARLAQGRRARLLAPCFGEYRAKLERAGAAVEEVGWEGSGPLPLAALCRDLGPGDQVWLAQPSNPLGLVARADDLEELLAACSRQGMLLVLDEALLCQRLEESIDDSLWPRLAQGAPLAVLRSLGKGLGLPGLRLGYLAAAPALAESLRRFQDPWSVNSLALALAEWAFREERESAPRRRLQLAAAAADLRSRLASRGFELDPAPGATGYFCLDLGRPRAAVLRERLAESGCFVRDCSSYGEWGRFRLRLNPRRPEENEVLAAALAEAARP